jgi:hypothetical protein
MDQYGDHIITGDTQETNVLLHHLLQDNEMEVPLDKLKLPKMMPAFKLREILNIADKIETGEIDDQLTVNKDLMIKKGLKRYYALKRLDRESVRVSIDVSNSIGADDLFTIRKK